jgi:hypothetical protein
LASCQHEKQCCRLLQYCQSTAGGLIASAAAAQLLQQSALYSACIWMLHYRIATLHASTCVPHTTKTNISKTTDAVPVRYIEPHMALMLWLDWVT